MKWQIFSGYIPLELDVLLAKSLFRKFSTTPINDRQLSRQKIRQKISVIKTNSFDWELITFDAIKKIVQFGILIHVLS